MKMALVAELQDNTTSLLKLLERVAEAGGKVLSIGHDREPTRREVVAVTVSMDIDVDNFEDLVQEIKNLGILIKSSGPSVELPITLIILIGEVFATDIKDTLDRLMKVGADVKKVEARIKVPTSTVSLSLETTQAKALADILDVAKQICKDKHLLMIRS